MQQYNRQCALRNLQTILRRIKRTCDFLFKRIFCFLWVRFNTIWTASDGMLVRFRTPNRRRFVVAISVMMAMSRRAPNIRQATTSMLIAIMMRPCPTVHNTWRKSFHINCRDEKCFLGCCWLENVRNGRAKFNTLIDWRSLIVLQNVVRRND